MLAREHIVPIFDKYNVTIAFENHNHNLKRTHPLRNGEISETGTIYLGEGSWGALDFPCASENSLMVVNKGVNHVWHVRRTRDSLNFTAIGNEGQTLDSLILPIQNES